MLLHLAGGAALWRGGTELLHVAGDAALWSRSAVLPWNRTTVRNGNHLGGLGVEAPADLSPGNSELKLHTGAKTGCDGHHKLLPAHVHWHLHAGAVAARDDRCEHLCVGLLHRCNARLTAQNSWLLLAAELRGLFCRKCRHETRAPSVPCASSRDTCERQGASSPSCPLRPVPSCPPCGGTAFGGRLAAAQEAQAPVGGTGTGRAAQGPASRGRGGQQMERWQEARFAHRKRTVRSVAAGSNLWGSRA